MSLEPIHHPLFSTITGDDWKRQLARARERRKERKAALATFIRGKSGQIFMDDPHAPAESAQQIADRWLAEDKAKAETLAVFKDKHGLRDLFTPDPGKEAARFLGFDIARTPDKGGAAFVDTTRLVRRTFAFEGVDMELMGEVIMGEAKGWSKRMVDEAVRAAIGTTMNCLRDSWTRQAVRPDVAVDDIVEICQRLRMEGRKRQPVGCIGHPETVRALFDHYARENHADPVTSADIVGRRVLMGIEFADDPALPRVGEGAFELHYDPELYRLRLREIALRPPAPPEQIPPA